MIIHKLKHYVSLKVRKAGINTTEKNRPFIFQLLEKLESTDTEDKKSLSDSLSVEQKANEMSERLSRPQPKTTSGKNSLNDLYQTQSFSKTKKEEDSAKNKIPQIKEQNSFGNKESERAIKTDDYSENKDDMQTENDVYLAESVGVDITVDSTVLREFDYNESVDMKD